MTDAVAGEQFGERAVARVRPGVVAHQSLRVDAVAGEEDEPALDEAGHSLSLLVVVE
jgi:hypothetical protein